jgi:hypothetical protein
MAEHDHDGTLSAELIGEGSLPPGSGGYADMDALVTAVDRIVIDMYRPTLSETSKPMGFQYAWYPWAEDKRALKIPGGPREFLLFEIRQSNGGYEAWLVADPATSTVSPRLDDLPSAISTVTCARWPALVGRAIPGMIHWNRELTAAGFRDVSVPGS